MLLPVTGDEIRQAFLHFFESKGHTVIPSSSLIPHGDPTLLLTTAGMVQIKPYFLELAVPPNPRLASCQKCFRTTDIDSVGDSKHLTFFEMLGNFSVGDYFKKEAITWAWEFVTEHLKLPPEKLRTTIYLDDNEAFEYWRQVGVLEDRILRFGEKDNFWGPAGDSGPCGPCSEIHYDFGEEVGCKKPSCGPGCGCGRFSEIWNLVFTQYNQDRDGKRTLLPKPNIDTGMGLERTAAVMQGKPFVYDTDPFRPIVDLIAQQTKKKYGSDEAVDRAIRIIAEHSRGIAFLIADGVLPSNEGRGYVLRRILRRASLFGRRLGLHRPFQGEISQVVINKMGHIYPELVNNRDFIQQVVKAEEDRFANTLDTGLNLVERLIEQAVAQGRSQLTGSEVFELHDTYGFDKELTVEIARERGLSVDLEGFEVEMACQRERARAARTISPVGIPSAEAFGKPEITIPTEFVGYKTTAISAKVIGLRVNSQQLEAVTEGQEVKVFLDKTPFYAEMGGQVGDTGEITGPRGKVVVTNTIGNYVHVGKVLTGEIRVGDEVTAQVDAERRLDIARNHTATHLLQTALRQVLGDGSRTYQKGSWVGPERFRFDYPSLVPIPKEQLKAIQHFVNEKIREDLPVRWKMVPYQQAIDEGAIALFEEKYGDTVRAVVIGETPVSAELCGGTHVKSTGEIGLFLILSENSIGTGLRRIEAVTGRGAESFVDSRLHDVEVVAQELDSSPDEVQERLRVFKAELATEHKRTLQLEKELALGIVDSLVKKAKKYDGVTVVAAKVPALSSSTLREMGDILRERLGSAVIVLGTVANDRPSFVAMVTPDLVGKGFHAGEIVKQVAIVTGGSGGGKAHLAQAGGKDKEKLEDALKSVGKLVRKSLLKKE